MISTPMMMCKAVWGWLESLMHFNENPGKSQLRDLWEGSGGDRSPVLWQLIQPLVFIIPYPHPPSTMSLSNPNILFFSTFLYPLSSPFKSTRKALTHPLN